MLAADESTVDRESLFDAIVMEDGQSDGRLPDPASTDESNGCQVFCQADDLVDQLAASEASSWGRWRWFAGYGGCKHKELSPLVI